MELLKLLLLAGYVIGVLIAMFISAYEVSNLSKAEREGEIYIAVIFSLFWPVLAVYSIFLLPFSLIYKFVGSSAGLLAVKRKKTSDDNLFIIKGGEQ